MSQELTTFNVQGFAVEIAPEALDQKASALEASAFIGRVSDGIEQEKAVAAMSRIVGLLRQAEDSRVAVKRPAIDYGRKVDGLAKQFCVELEEENLRLSKLVADFQSLELARSRSEEAAHNEALTDLERRRETELAKAATIEERDEIQERYNQEAAFLSKANAPVRAPGLAVGEQWVVEVFDPLALARAYPQCVNLIPRKREIYDLLDSGIQPPGVTASKIMKTSVRLKPERKEITV